MHILIVFGRLGRPDTPEDHEDHTNAGIYVVLALGSVHPHNIKTPQCREVRRASLEDAKDG